MNVLAGERYKMVTKESKALLRGEYGRLPAPVNEEVRKKCIGDDKVITHRPADDIPPELDKYREEIRDYYQQEEDVRATPCSRRWQSSTSSTVRPSSWVWTAPCSTRKKRPCLSNPNATGRLCAVPFVFSAYMTPVAAQHTVKRRRTTMAAARRENHVHQPLP